MTTITMSDPRGDLRKIVDGANAITLDTLIAGERGVDSVDSYLVAVGEWNITAVAASQSDVAISSGAPALLKSVVMNTGQSGEVTIKDGTTTLQSITPGANTKVDYGGGRCNTSLVLTTAASAACLVLWKPQG